MNKVTVYHIGPTCVQCEQTKRVMDREGITYDLVDLRENPDLAGQFRDQGYLSAPIVTAGDQIWSGFKLERIKGLHRSKGN
jgi:glutaredoxin-like protein NrdH